METNNAKKKVKPSDLVCQVQVAVRIKPTLNPPTVIIENENLIL